MPPYGVYREGLQRVFELNYIQASFGTLSVPEPRLQSYADEDGSPLDSYYGSPLSRSPKDSEAALLDSA